MKRREFISTACKTGASVLVGGMLFDLAKVPFARASSRLSANEVREIPLNLIDTPELADIGGPYHLQLDDLERDILVVHVSKDKYVAVDIKCTHRGCDVEYQSSDQQFSCPCHDSLFDLSGAVLKGPATKPLNWYGAELRGEEVVVTVYGPHDPVPANSIPPKIITPAKDSTAVPADSIKIQSDPFSH